MSASALRTVAALGALGVDDDDESMEGLKAETVEERAAIKTATSNSKEQGILREYCGIMVAIVFL